MDAAPRRVLQTHFPGEDARYFAPMVIGSNPQQADEGASLILSGTKTLTSSPFWDYPDNNIPFVGALSVLLDGARKPRGVVETTRVLVMPFNAVTDEMAHDYGEGDRTVEWWKRAMRAFYERSAMRHGADFTENAPLIWEWFAVVRRL